MLFKNLAIHPQLEINFRKSSLLKSSVYSARVEGFSDTLTFPKKESQNLLSAYNYIYSTKAPHSLTLNLTKKLHHLVLKDLSSSPGSFRQQPWAIFNQSGIVIYLAPPFQEVPQLMNEYVGYINSLKDHSAVIAAVAQFIFEKIHPFADGNGRVGRLISSFILEKEGYGFRGLAAFEEYIEEHRLAYYANLEPTTDCSGFVEFFLEALVSQLKKDIGKVSQTNHVLPEDSLLLRRREILNIIRDHPHCTFDFLHRRFSAINVKTLHYDISQLQKAGYIRKLGKTRGVSYRAIDMP